MQSNNQLFCGNCGNKLNEGAVFCPKCGAKVVASLENYEGNLQQTNIDTTKPTKKGKNKMLLIATIVVVVLAILIGAIAIGFDNKEKDGNATDQQIYLAKCVVYQYDEGKVISKQIETRRSDGQIESLEKHDEKGFASRVNYIFGENNEVIEIQIKEKTEKYSVRIDYTKQGNKIVGKGNITRDGNEYDWEYIYQDGQRISYKLFVDNELGEAEYKENKTTTVTESTGFFGIKRKTVSEYDEKTRTSRLSQYSTKSTDSDVYELSGVTEMKYDEMGNVVEIIEYNEKKQFEEKTVTEYNDKRIPLKEEIYEGDSAPQLRLQLKEETADKITLIRYYDNEISGYIEYTIQDGRKASQKAYDENYMLDFEQTYNEHGSVLETIEYDEEEIRRKTVYEYAQVK